MGTKWNASLPATDDPQMLPGPSATFAMRFEERSVPNFCSFAYIRQLAAFENDAAENHLRVQVSRGNGFDCRDHEVEGIGRPGRQTGFVRAAANHPAGGLADHFAVLVQQKDRSPSRFDFLVT